eukprot:354312-Amphidinium_carterae.1
MHTLAAPPKLQLACDTMRSDEFNFQWCLRKVESDEGTEGKKRKSGCGDATVGGVATRSSKPEEHHTRETWEF